jgi:colanic acid/amylovoran biosynthesis glycosyltransferase
MKHSEKVGQQKKPMPELTVSMPAYNTGKYIGEAIESVLRQEGVDFELIVVDDGSEDNTAEVVRSFKDPRIRLISNEKNMGIAYCHNLVIEQSISPFIAHVDSDDMVLPGALQKMVDMLKSSPNIGQVHCKYNVIDKDGEIISHSATESDMDYRRALLVLGGIMNHLRTYRRDVFKVVGKFNENLRYSEDCEIGLRIVDKFEIKLVPEYLYCRRCHDSNTSQTLHFKELRFWYQRLIFSHGLAKNNKVLFLKQKEYKLNVLLMVGLYNALRLTWKRLSGPIFNHIYKSIVRLLSLCPIGFSNSKGGSGFNDKKRVAYYLWHYPVLSETFIQREIAALIRSRVAVEVIADSPKDLELLDEDVKSLVDTTHYLLPLNKQCILKYGIYFLFTRPLIFLKSFLFLITHQYERTKSFTNDRLKFYKAVYLAGLLRDNRVSHIHSPWADRSAFTSLIASRLLGVPYSVQGRAGDIHRRKNQYALPEKFNYAEFVITNSRYNQLSIEALLYNPRKVKIHIIHEGIDLEKLEPEKRQEKTISNPTRILTVARLIEEKGLIFLLKACRILKDIGYSCKCDIIGGIERQFVSYYITLMRLHRQLQLEDCVNFLGPRPFNSVLEKYNNSEIFVLPCVVASHGGRDISPNSLIEAMAMKLPVISTTIAALPEIVEDRVSGVLVPPNDENALAEAIIRLINNPDLRRKLGENARKRVEERFDINKNILKYVDLFTRDYQLKLANTSTRRFPPPS